MKKIYSTLLTIAALGFAACTDSESVVDNNPSVTSSNNEVKFGMYLGQQSTRSTGGATGNITTTTLQTGTHAASGFGIMAYMKKATADAADGSLTCYDGDAWRASIPNFMYNQQVIYSTDHWTYTPVKFWPNDFSTSKVDNKEGEGETTEATGSANAGQVSFFAYAPYVVPNDYSTISTTHTTYSAFDVYSSSTAASDGIVAITSNAYDGEPKVKYVLANADLANAVDLLWGMRGNTTGYRLANGTTSSDGSNPYNTDLTKQTVGEQVNFLFKHALAKIGGHTYETTGKTGLQVILDLDNGSQDAGVQPGTAITGGVKEDATLVTLKSVTIKDLKSYDSEQKSNLVTTGWFNIAQGTWEEEALGATSGSTYESEVTNTSSGDFAMNPAIKEGTITYDSGWKIDGTAQTGVTTTVQDVYTDESNAPGLLLIPSTTDQTLVVTVSYVVRTYDTKLSSNASGGEGTWSKVTQTITNKVTIPGGSLTSNKYYKLVMHLGLTSVKFTATVADWDEALNNSTTPDEDDKVVYLPSNTIGSGEALTVTIPDGNIPQSGGTKELTVELGSTSIAAANYSVSIPTGDATWLSHSSGTLTATANTTGAERSSTVTVTYVDSNGTHTGTVTVTQAGS